MQTSSNERHLQAVEEDIHLGESLIGRITALAARSAAQGQPYRAREACRLRTEAEAKATTMVSEAIARGSVQAINYFVADKYLAALKVLANSPNQKVLMLPMETTGVLGSLAGIAEIARDTFQQRGPTPPRAPQG